MTRTIFIISLLSVILWAPACRQKKVPGQPTAIQKVSAPAKPVTTENKSQSWCDSLFAEGRRLDSLKGFYFRKYILSKALKNNSLSEPNKKFLLALDRFLSEEQSQLDSPLTTEKILFPIFTIEEGHTGIFGFPRYDHQNGLVMKDISFEHRLISQTNYYRKGNWEPNRRTYFPTIFDSLYSAGSKGIYIYTDKTRKRSEITNFGYIDGECLAYYHFPLKKGTYSSSDKVLFGSRFPLDLIFENNQVFDKVIPDTTADGCYDCPIDSYPTVSFAKIAGTEDLYFMYSDTFPISTEIYYPSRSLTMKLNGKLISLWAESIDLLGCSCI